MVMLADTPNLLWLQMAFGAGLFLHYQGSHVRCKTNIFVWLCDFSESDPWLQPHGYLLSVYTLLLTYSLFCNYNKTVKSESMPFGQINLSLDESPSEQEKTIQNLGSHRPSISNIRSRYLKIKKLIMLGRRIHFPSTFLGSWLRHPPSPIKS